MRRTILGLAGLLGLGGLATGQYQSPQYPPQQYPGANQGGFYPGGPYQGGGFNPNNFMPNIYNPQNQPLSPYLNLLRGGNAATNYYYGVRPGTLGAMRGGFGAPFTAMGGNRPLFFPQLATAPDPLEQPFSPSAGNVLPPAGHYTVFNNTMGYYPGGFGQAGGTRTGLSGIGASSARPPAPRR